ncbi:MULTISPECIES: hypothetical protein [unclassified Acinetobacter]
MKKSNHLKRVACTVLSLAILATIGCAKTDAQQNQPQTLSLVQQDFNNTAKNLLNQAQSYRQNATAEQKNSYFQLLGIAAKQQDYAKFGQDFFQHIEPAVMQRAAEKEDDKTVQQQFDQIIQ